MMLGKVARRIQPNHGGGKAPFITQLFCFGLGASLVYGICSFTMLHSAVLTGMARELPTTTNFFGNAMQGSSRGGLVSSSTIDKMKKRISLLENKLDTFLAFGSDPFLGTKETLQCDSMKEIDEWMTCFDYFPPRRMNKVKDDCIVYDFGIRRDPEFGFILSEPPYNCKIFAFDPSPTTREWLKDKSNPKAQKLLKNKNYKMFLYGAGYQDETIKLREYNWNQVTLYHYPSSIVDKTNCTDGECRYKRFETQEFHDLPVRSLESIMKELNHSHIDLVKVDIEGSEYRFLEGIIKSGVCRHVDQLLLEWHHYTLDDRYGASSWPHINVFVRLLQTECGLQQYHCYDEEGWPNNNLNLAEMGVTLRYNLASFMRDLSSTRLKNPPNKFT